ncbi:MAG: hypothetical protein AAB407_00095 [Patescibacteria group bacterium]
MDNYKARLRRMAKDAFIRNPLLIAGALLTVLAVITGYQLWDVGHLLVLRAPGETMPGFSGTRYDVFTIIVSGVMAWAMNSLLAYALYDKSRFVSYLLAYFNIFLVVLIFIAVGVIISAN